MLDQLGARFALAFLLLCIVLLIYAAVHWRRRRKQLAEELMRRGWQHQALPDDPEARRLAIAEQLPEGLFYPNGCPPKRRDGHFKTCDVLPRLLDAWRSSWGGVHVDLLEVSVTRQHRRPGQHGESKQLNRTVLRFALDSPEREPPGFLVEERVLFKSQVKDAVAIHGREHLEPHYFVFSGASAAELEHWLDDEIVELLARRRFWTLAVHDGVFFLTRNTSLQTIAELPSFLDEGRDFVDALARGATR